MAEHYYVASFSANAQDTIDDLTTAGEWYPYDHRFRNAQAIELYEWTRYQPGALIPASVALRYALIADPNSVALLGALVDVLSRMNECKAWSAASARLKALAPHSQKVDDLIARGCHDAR